MQTIKLKVNGYVHELMVKPHQTLLDILRDNLQLTGTKEGCGLGECGVLHRSHEWKASQLVLILALEADGAEILTIEGLAQEGNLHPVQKAFVEKGAIQVGFVHLGW